MFITKKKNQVISKIIDVICDSCKKTTREEIGLCFNFASIKESFGYGSKLDEMNGEGKEFHICEKCYKKVLKVLKLKRN